VEPQIRVAEVQQLVAGAQVEGKPKLEVANILLRLLHAQVRYTGIEFGEAAQIPRTPAETLTRRYGDCKDQAAVLVAMLRAAGIPAHLALLRSGVGQDIEPDLPGIGIFDHAIVYVPGEPDLWADPTDPFARFNELPLSDQGRMAMIVREGGGLIGIPESPASENRVIETREFFLSGSSKPPSPLDRSSALTGATTRTPTRRASRRSWAITPRQRTCRKRSQRSNTPLRTTLPGLFICGSK
jgi:hypothetical protein